MSVIKRLVDFQLGRARSHGLTECTRLGWDDAWEPPLLCVIPTSKVAGNRMPLIRKQGTSLRRNNRRLLPFLMEWMTPMPITHVTHATGVAVETVAFRSVVNIQKIDCVAFNMVNARFPRT